MLKNKGFNRSTNELTITFSSLNRLNVSECGRTITGREVSFAKASEVKHLRTHVELKTRKKKSKRNKTKRKKLFLVEKSAGKTGKHILPLLACSKVF